MGVLPSQARRRGYRLGCERASSESLMSVPTVHIGSGEAGILGYGSLLSKASLERTLKREYQGPFLACSLPDWRRTWDVRQPNRAFYCETADGRMYPENILYLNVTRGEGAILNGVVIVVTREQLLALDAREWMYDRVAVTEALQDVRVTGGDVFLYASKPEFVVRDVESPRIAAVRATYLAIVETGLANLGEPFRAAYERSTEPVPEHLVIQDRFDEAKANEAAELALRKTG
jgi:hypothetical protein